MLYYALGVLSAGILALLVAPPLWRRAVRLTRRAIEQTMPMTAAEIQAEKDQIRAAFAVSTRRLDATIERLESQVTDQLIDINRKREIIAHLTAEGSLSAEDMIALEKQRDELLLKVAAQESALADAARRHTALELQVAELDAALAAAKAAHERTIAEHETQRLEIVARDTELDNLRDSVAAVKTTSTVEEVARAGLETEMSGLRASLALERRKVADSESAAADSEAKRVAALADVAARDAELGEVRAEMQAAKSKIEELSLRLVAAEAAGMSLLAVEESKAELEARLSHVETLNQRLEADLAAARTETAATSDADTAALRGKLLEIGAAVARLSARSDGPSIVPLMADEAAKPQPPAADEPADEQKLQPPISLAERIRALQQAGGTF